MDQTLPRDQRIRKWSEMETLLRKGRLVRTPLWDLRWGANVLGISRLGVITGKRLGNSPARKRWRRLVREAFRRHKDGIPGALDMVVIPRKGPVDLGFASVEGEWLRTLAKLPVKPKTETTNDKQQSRSDQKPAER